MRGTSTYEQPVFIYFDCYSILSGYLIYHEYTACSLFSEMASTNNNPKVLLKRTFSLKEQSSLILCTDTMAQSSRFVVEEFLDNIPDEMPIVFVSFETPNRPKYARQFIDASGKTTQQLVAALQPYLPQPQEQAPKMHLVIFDTFNYICLLYTSRCV